MVGVMPLGELTKEIVKTKYTIRKNNIMSELTVGSKYIHFTKYGSVNKGEVELCCNEIIIDTKNLAKYYSPYIVNTKGILLNLDGRDGKIYKIEEELTIEGAKRIEDLLLKIQLQKSNNI